MDLLKAEIDRKRKATAALIDETNPGGKIGSTRFVRQSDLMEQRLRQQAEKQAELDMKRLKTAPSAEAAAAVPPSNAGPVVAPVAAAGAPEHMALTVGEVKRRLRSAGHPITLFGESNDDRAARLRLVELSAVEEEDFMLTAGHTNAARAGSAAALADGAEDDEDDEDEDGDRDEDGDGKQRAERRVYIFEPTHFAEDKKLPKRKVIYKYFRFLLKCWEHDLSERPEMDKNTAKGKMETKTQKQCKDYIRYLFKLCKKNDVPFDIEHKLHLVSC